jgi:hypothetical protein
VAGVTAGVISSIPMRRRSIYQMHCYFPCVTIRTEESRRTLIFHVTNSDVLCRARQVVIGARVENRPGVTPGMGISVRPFPNPSRTSDAHWRACILVPVPHRYTATLLPGVRTPGNPTRLTLGHSTRLRISPRKSKKSKQLSQSLTVYPPAVEAAMAGLEKMHV